MTESNLRRFSDYIHTIEKELAAGNATEQKEDGTIHYLKPISEHGGRMLRVVTDVTNKPPRGITVFFDRRAKEE